VWDGEYVWRAEGCGFADSDGRLRAGRMDGDEILEGDD